LKDPNNDTHIKVSRKALFGNAYAHMLKYLHTAQCFVTCQMTWQSAQMQSLTNHAPISKWAHDL